MASVTLLPSTSTTSIYNYAHLHSDTRLASHQKQVIYIVLSNNMLSKRVQSFVYCHYIIVIMIIPHDMVYGL